MLYEVITIVAQVTGRRLRPALDRPDARDDEPRRRVDLDAPVRVGLGRDDRNNFV